METFLQNLLTSASCLLEEATVFGQSGEEFWHSTVLKYGKIPFAAGFAPTRLNARKIAIAEYLERNSFLEWSRGDSHIKNLWGLNLIPTGCGFAAGFDRNNTVRRSILEAAERWTMSHWIDEQCAIDEIPTSTVARKLDSISKFFINQFTAVRFFEKPLLLEVNGQLIGAKVGFTMGLTDIGIFPGSSAQLSEGNPWQHALLESYRHYLLIKNGPESIDTYPFNKNKFFSKNKDIALKQIASATNQRWPTPKICFHHSQPFMEDQYFIARTIFSGWKSWNQGPIERFLY